MLIQVESVKEFKELAEAMGFVKGTAVSAPEPAPVKKKAPAKKTAPKQEAKPVEKQEEKPVETVAEKTEEKIVTQADVLEHVKAHFGDNVQGIKDMLSRVGSAKISEIADANCAKALSILKGE